jgi:ribosomal protein S27E
MKMSERQELQIVRCPKCGHEQVTYAKIRRRCVYCGRYFKFTVGGVSRRVKRGTA